MCPIQSKDKQRKKGDGQLVHIGLFDAAIRVQDHWVSEIVKILTCQLIFLQPKRAQIRQFDDFGRN
jgi:hypothetical protein